MFSITWVETRSHSFFCRIDSLQEGKKQVSSERDVRQLVPNFVAQQL